MRRFFFWYLPLIAAIAAALAFGAGFYSFLRGETGTPVDLIPAARASEATSPQQMVTPIIMGDSLARGAGDTKGLGIGGRLDAELKRRNLQAKKTTNIAINGTRTADLLRQLESANVKRLIGESNVVIVSIGGNDLWGGTDWRNAPPDDPDKVMDGVLDRIDRTIDIIREASPRARIYFIGLYNPFAASPAGPQLSSLVARWNGKLMERLSGDSNVTVVQTADIFAHRDRLSLDRFHPGDEGYALIARRIAESI